MGIELKGFGRNIGGLEDRLVKQAADKDVINLARYNYHVQSENIEHLLKENAQIIIQVQVSLSPAFSTRLPVTKSPLGDSK